MRASHSSSPAARSGRQSMPSMLSWRSRSGASHPARDTTQLRATHACIWDHLWCFHAMAALGQASSTACIFQIFQQRRIHLPCMSMSSEQPWVCPSQGRVGLEAHVALI